MPTSLAQATKTLVNGSTLSWSKYQDHKAGLICPATSAQRRLLQFLLKQPPARLATADLNLFPGLINAWNGTADPASEESGGSDAQASDVWRIAG